MPRRLGLKKYVTTVTCSAPSTLPLLSIHTRATLTGSRRPRCAGWRTLGGANLFVPNLVPAPHERSTPLTLGPPEGCVEARALHDAAMVAAELAVPTPRNALTHPRPFGEVARVLRVLFS